MKIYKPCRNEDTDPLIHLGYQIMILANYGFMVDDVDSKEGVVLSP